LRRRYRGRSGRGDAGFCVGGRIRREGSDAEDHDLGGLDEGGGGLAGLEVHLTGGTGGDDGGDLLAADGDFDFGHESADADLIDAADELVAATDAAGVEGALGDSLAAGAEQEAVDLTLGNAMMAAGCTDAADFAAVDPLLDGGEADLEFERGLAGFEERIGLLRCLFGRGLASWGAAGHVRGIVPPARVAVNVRGAVPAGLSFFFVERPGTYVPSFLCGAPGVLGGEEVARSARAWESRIGARRGGHT